jgi:hypothetical protein
MPKGIYKRKVKPAHKYRVVVEVVLDGSCGQRNLVGAIEDALKYGQINIRRFGMSSKYVSHRVVGYRKPRNV